LGSEISDNKGSSFTIAGSRLIVPGFDKIAELIALDKALINSDLVITAEGKLDSQSFNWV